MRMKLPSGLHEEKQLPKPTILRNEQHTTLKTKRTKFILPRSVNWKQLITI